MAGSLSYLEAKHIYYTYQGIIKVWRHLNNRHMKQAKGMKGTLIGTSTEQWIETAKSLCCTTGTNITLLCSHSELDWN